MECFFKTGTEKELDRSGWMKSTVTAMKRHSQSVNLVDGRYTTVDMEKMCPLYATALQ